MRAQLLRACKLDACRFSSRPEYGFIRFDPKMTPARSRLVDKPSMLLPGDDDSFLQPLTPEEADNQHSRSKDIPYRSRRVHGRYIEAIDKALVEASIQAQDRYGRIEQRDILISEIEAVRSLRGSITPEQEESLKKLKDAQAKALAATFRLDFRKVGLHIRAIRAPRNLSQFALHWCIIPPDILSGERTVDYVDPPSSELKVCDTSHHVKVSLFLTILRNV